MEGSAHPASGVDKDGGSNTKTHDREYVREYDPGQQGVVPAHAPSQAQKRRGAEQAESERRWLKDRPEGCEDQEATDQAKKQCSMAQEDLGVWLGDGYAVQRS